jgi:adenosine deaminase
MMGVDEIYSLADKAAEAGGNSLCFRNFIKLIPKTEIHLHAEAVVQFKSYLSLNEKYDIDKRLATEADFKRFLDITSLSQMIEHYIYLQSFFREAEDFLLLTKDVEAYARRNGIYYAELYISPSIVMKKSTIGFDDLLDVLDAGFGKVQEESGIRIAIIIDVSRTFGFENAMSNLNRLIEYKSRRPESKRFIGIGLGGAEIGNRASSYEAVFTKAREHGLRTVAHAGEEVESESIWEAITSLKAERIGHGTSAMFDEKLIGFLADSRIPLEICPTSNVITRKYVARHEDHPIRTFFDRGLFVTVNTDDPILFDIELNEEYERLHTHLNFSIRDMLALIRNNLFATFLTDAEKADYWEKTLASTRAALRDVYGLTV